MFLLCNSIDSNDLYCFMWYCFWNALLFKNFLMNRMGTIVRWVVLLKIKCDKSPRTQYICTSVWIKSITSLTNERLYACVCLCTVNRFIDFALRYRSCVCLISFNVKPQILSDRIIQLCISTTVIRLIKLGYSLWNNKPCILIYTIK